MIKQLNGLINHIQNENKSLGNKLRLFTKTGFERLFENINKGDTPFTLVNVNHIKKMSYYMIACIVLSGIGEGILNSSMRNEFTFGIEMFDIVEILFLFSLSYIFEYGYEIQKDSKGRMYGDE